MKEWYLQRTEAGQYFWDDTIQDNCVVYLTEKFAEGYTPFSFTRGEE
jgi:hypothetical protein